MKRSRPPRAARLRLAGLCASLLLAACQRHADKPAEGISTSPGKPAADFSGILDGETLHFTGTEPFWGGAATGERLTWTTPENPDGTTIPVRRMAGNNGLGLSGTLDGRPFDLAVTLARCSDGMSDRSYPFAVTVRLGEDVRQGCGWTGSNPPAGGE